MVTEAELVVLLHRAGERRRSIQGRLRSWKDADRSRAAMERAFPDGFGRPMYRRAVTGAAVQETWWRVIEDQEGRRRSELLPAASSPSSTWGIIEPAVAVDDGTRSLEIHDDRAVVWRSRPSRLRRLLDPSWLLTHGLEVGSTGEASGRPTVNVRAYRRSRPWGGVANDMAEERRVVVDLEGGFLHSDIALLDGEGYDGMELRDLVVDGPIPAGTFALTLPPGLNLLDATRDQVRTRRPRWPLHWVGFGRYDWPRAHPGLTQVIADGSG